MLTNIPRDLSQTHSVETANQLAHGRGSVGLAEVCDSEERGGKLYLKQNGSLMSKTDLNGVIIRALCLLHNTNRDTRTSGKVLKRHYFFLAVCWSDTQRER